MNLERDLQKLRKERALKESAIAQLEQKKIYYQLIQGCRKYDKVMC